MTDAEKLKTLIEMAWENGYPKWLRREYYPAISTAVNGEEYVDYEAEHTLFDHDFVKALCRSKGIDGTLRCRCCGSESVCPGGRSRNTPTSYEPDLWKPGFDDWCDGCQSEGKLSLYAWEYYLQQLALSSDRIGYLAAEFLPTPPKS